MPVPGLHVPALWPWSGAAQTTGLAPVQAPVWQVSVCVQALPSLQVVPLPTNWQPAVQHWLPSHCSPAPGCTMPSPHELITLTVTEQVACLSVLSVAEKLMTCGPTSPSCGVQLKVLLTGLPEVGSP